MIKVLHCIGSPRIGGVERLVIELLVAQKRAGLHVDLMLDSREGEYYRYLQENNINITDSGIKSGYDFGFRQLKRIRSLSNQYNIVHLHNFSVLLSLSVKRAKTFYTIHGLSKGVRKEGTLKHLLRETLKKHFLNRFDFVIANSEFTMENARNHYGLSKVPCQVVLNGVKEGMMLPVGYYFIELKLQQGSGP